LPNRNLTPKELAQANALLDNINTRLIKLAHGDKELLFAFRRKVFKELSYAERSKPAIRRKLKALKWKEQGGKCHRCKKPMPEKYSVLDRVNAVDGYTAENTHLVCPECNIKTQKERGYR